MSQNEILPVVCQILRLGFSIFFIIILNCIQCEVSSHIRERFSSQLYIVSIQASFFRPDLLNARISSAVTLVCFSPSYQPHRALYTALPSLSGSNWSTRWAACPSTVAFCRRWKPFCFSFYFSLRMIGLPNVEITCWTDCGPCMFLPCLPLTGISIECGHGLCLKFYIWLDQSFICVGSQNSCSHGWSLGLINNNRDVISDMKT